MLSGSFLTCLLAITALGHKQNPIGNSNEDIDRVSRWTAGYSFTGIQTFAHLLHKQCLVEQDAAFDLAVIGVPFDTSVAYRPGARFGPRAIRAASQRQLPSRGFNHAQGINPYQNWATVLDCGDVPVSPL
jgi:agmatinase